MTRKRLDLVGQKFGLLTVLSFAYVKSSNAYWNCICDCGKEKVFAGCSLKSNHTKSCGCSKKEIKDLVGQKFNFLSVLHFSKRENRRTYWKCICDCGIEIVTRSDGLQSGHVKSCGCLNHGKEGSSIYTRWVNMIQRCTNPNTTSYKNYGGRGISVCDKWLHSFTSFYQDVGDPPDGLTLDRIDNDGNYEPCNVKWSSWEEQANNRRNSVKNNLR